jgi:outer membrane lipoprotein SlyB
MTDEQIRAQPIREAVGVFAGEGAIREAIDELMSSGFRREEIGLLAGEETVRQSLADFYTDAFRSVDAPDSPNMAFVAKESVGDTVHAYLGSLFYAGTTVAAGAVVTSAAVLGGALFAATAGAVAIGALGGVLGLIIHESDAERLEEQLDEGHLLLFVRTRDAAREKQAVGILSKHTPIEVRVVSSPAPGPEAA